MAGQEAIWHVVLDHREQGPLTEAEVLECLGDGRLAESDLIWRPGFPDWKSVGEVDDFRQPPRQTSIRAPVPRKLKSKSSAPA